MLPTGVRRQVFSLKNVSPNELEALIAPYHTTVRCLDGSDLKSPPKAVSPQQC